jgi:hypothetical protein
MFGFLAMLAASREFECGAGEEAPDIVALGRQLEKVVEETVAALRAEIGAA